MTIPTPRPSRRRGLARTDSMRGILIGQPYIGMILDGRKTWEMRSRRWRLRGQIALIQLGTKTVVGVANLVDCIGPLTDDQRLATVNLHCVEPKAWLDPEMAKYRIAWVLSDVKRLTTPVPYPHPSGAQTPVILDDGVVQQIAAMLATSQ